MLEPNLLYSTIDIQDYLETRGVSVCNKTVVNWMKRGWLPYSRPAWRYQILGKDFNAFFYSDIVINGKAEATEPNESKGNKEL